MRFLLAALVMFLSGCAGLSEAGKTFGDRMGRTAHDYNGNTVDVNVHKQ